MEFKQSRQRNTSRYTPPTTHPPVTRSSTVATRKTTPGTLHLLGTGVYSWLKPPYHRSHAITAVFCCVSLLGAGYIYSRPHTAKPADNSTARSRVDYQTLTPNDKPASELGGWHRVSPQESTPVYAYIDVIDKIEVSVSQQPLPDKFIEGTDSQLAQLAKDFGANQEIKADGIKVYVGTSSKGPQSAIMIKNGLLILIKSQSKISDDAWARYAESLR